MEQWFNVDGSGASSGRRFSKRKEIGQRPGEKKKEEKEFSTMTTMTTRCQPHETAVRDDLPSSPTATHGRDRNDDLFRSWVSGSVRGVINGLLESGALGKTLGKTVDGAVKGVAAAAPSGAKPSPPSPVASPLKAVQRPLLALVPGFFAFETHHQAAHFLFHHVASENYDSSVSFSPESSASTTALALLEKVRNHSLHFAAGATGGFTFGLAASAIELSFKTKAMVNHTVSHGALFGGFDCFNDIHNYLLKVDDPHAETMIPHEYRRPWSTFLSGGFAGMAQALVKDALSGALGSVLANPVRIIRAFPGSAAAFSANFLLRSTFVTEEEHGGHH